MIFFIQNSCIIECSPAFSSVFFGYCFFLKKKDVTIFEKTIEELLFLLVVFHFFRV
jgi:hypothetical protein